MSLRHNDLSIELPIQGNGIISTVRKMETTCGEWRWLAAPTKDCVSEVVSLALPTEGPVL